MGKETVSSTTHWTSSVRRSPLPLPPEVTLGQKSQGCAKWLGWCSRSSPTEEELHGTNYWVLGTLLLHHSSWGCGPTPDGCSAGPPDLHLELTFSQICNTDWPERTRKQSDQFGANVFSTVGWMDGWTLEWLVFFVVWKKVRLPA